MRLYEKYTTYEIAEIMNCSFETIRLRMHHFKIPLRKKGQRTIQEHAERIALRIKNKLLELPEPERLRVIEHLNKWIFSNQPFTDAKPALMNKAERKG